MEFNFKIKDDKLIGGDILDGNSGNVNTYSCRFDIAENVGFVWICVFRKDGNVYQQVIEDRKCMVPYEVLGNSGFVEIGCYGTKENKRISTNWLQFKVQEGAYCDATIPEEPTPDIWETLIINSIPYIGNNGNWYVYDRDSNEYKDSGKTSRGDKGEKGDKGEPGYTPQRGVDYWTENDRNEVRQGLEEDLNFEERLARVVGNAGNSIKKEVSGEIVEIDDISPLEHIMRVRVRSKNIASGAVYQNIIGNSTSGVIGANVALYKGKTYTMSFDTEDTGATIKVVTYNRPIILNTTQRIVADGTRKSVTFTMSDDFVKDYRITLMQLVTTEISSGLCSNLQIEEGAEATEYTEYVSDLTNMDVSVYDASSQDQLEKYVPLADGTVEGVLSKYPSTSIETNAIGVVIDCEYNRDINKAYEELTNAIISLGGNV